MIAPARALVLLLLGTFAGCDSSSPSPTTDTDVDGDGDGDDDGDDQGVSCQEESLPLAGLRRLTRAELDGAVRTAFPAIAGTWAGPKLGPDPMSAAGFSNAAADLLIGIQTAEELLDTAQDIADLVTAEGTFSQVLPCVADSEPCKDQFVDTIGGRVFRRPLTDAEQSRYLELLNEVEANSDFTTAARTTLTSLLMSPHFVYRSEVGTRVDDQTHSLRPWEIASALSFTFGGTGPSEELLARAQAGELDDPATRVEIARELLRSAGGRDSLHRFFREWTEYGAVETRMKDGVAEFAEIRTSMVTETRHFLDEVLYEREGGIKALLTADYTVLDPALAAFYGYGSPDEAGVTTRPEAWGVGLLAQPSILAGHAHGDSSSPTLRGRLVYERLFCGTVPPPPPQIPPIEPPAPGTHTTRERYEKVHAANKSCQSCHRLMDPIGFAFEHFDETGRFRPDEHGLPIDTAADVVGPDGTMLAVDGLTDLATQAAEIPTVSHCVASHLETYVFAGLAQGRCASAQARQQLVEDDASLLDFIAALAGTDAFVLRRTSAN